MRLRELESFINTMYRLNLISLKRLVGLRDEKGGLSYSNVSEYNVRLRDDDRYRRIKVELWKIKEDGEDKATAKERLYSLLSERIDELSDESVERIRLHGAGRMAGPDSFAATRNEDSEFLESCQIKGDVSWIKK